MYSGMRTAAVCLTHPGVRCPYSLYCVQTTATSIPYSGMSRAVQAIGRDNHSQMVEPYSYQSLFTVSRPISDATD